MYMHKLRGIIVAQGLTLGEFGQVMGWSYATMHRKISGRSEWTLNEVIRCKEILHLTDDEVKEIFSV